MIRSTNKPNEVETDLPEDEAIALALELCPPGESIEIHAAACDVFPCSCLPRVIRKELGQN